MRIKTVPNEIFTAQNAKKERNAPVFNKINFVRKIMMNKLNVAL